MVTSPAADIVKTRPGGKSGETSAVIPAAPVAMVAVSPAGTTSV